MPVTEFATLPLTDPLTKENPTLSSALFSKLKAAQTVLEQASGHNFRYFQQIEDPSVIYIVGKWDSPATHSSFLPSPENQQLLQLLKGDISNSKGRKMEMWHLDTDVFSLPTTANDKWVFSAPVISCGRHFVAKEKKIAFEKKFGEVRRVLEVFTRPYRVVGGWRIEKEEEGKEEFSLFSGFESVEQHEEFAKTEGFTRYRELVGFVEGLEVRHLRAIEGL